MGQLSIGVMWGAGDAKLPPDQDVLAEIEGWDRYTVYTDDSVAFAEGGKIVGVMVACQNSDWDDVPELKCPIELQTVATRYPLRLQDAKVLFDDFAKKLRGDGGSVGEPSLWLVEVETS